MEAGLLVALVFLGISCGVCGTLWLQEQKGAYLMVGVLNLVALISVIEVIG